MIRSISVLGMGMTRKWLWATIASLIGAAAPAFADGVLVLNSDDVNYSVVSRSKRMEVAKLPMGREPHHLIRSADGSGVFLASTLTNELLELDAATGERRRVIPDIVDPYQLGFSPDGKWFVTAAYRLDHVDIYSASDFKLVKRIFIESLPSHLAFDKESKTVFVTIQQTGRLIAIDLETQTMKWNVGIGVSPAGVVMLPDDRRLLVGMTGEDGLLVVDPQDGRLTGRLKTGRGAHNFWPQGDGRHYFLTNRLDGTVSRIDTQEMRVTHQIRVPGGPDCIDMTADGKELWVTQRFLRRVAVVDLETMRMVASIPVGKSPHGVFVLGRGPTPVASAVPGETR